MELLLLLGMGLDQNIFTFFLRLDQPFQVIAVQDIGKIVGHIFDNPIQFSGRIIEIAGDEITGNVLSGAAEKLIRYRRFDDFLLSANDFLGRLTASTKLNLVSRTGVM